MDNIRHEVANGQWELQINSLSNDANIRQLPLKTLLVQLELHQVIKPLYAYFAEYRYKFLQDSDIVLGQFSGERQQFLKAIVDHTQFKKIWGSLDIESLYQQYGCERSRVVAALDYLQAQGAIILESKKITEVFAVKEAALSQPELVQTLSDYFLDKEEKEIQRIAALIRFFELDRCLTANLARYFDDQNAPEQCGHCSVCRGQVATLAYSSQPQMPDDTHLNSVLSGFKQHIETKTKQPPSLGTYCRFLAGISIPLFSRNKVRQLDGFGCCEQVRFQTIKEKVVDIVTGLT